MEKKCRKCKMKNHFAKMCRIRDQESQRRTQKAVKSVSKKPTRCIHRIEEAEPAITDEVYYMYSVIDSSRSKYMIELQLRSGRTSNWIEVTTQIDSGSEANFLRMPEDFVKIQNRSDLKKTRAILKAYSGERVFPKG